jgi:multidrug transporter EmrE-like cation transporter
VTAVSPLSAASRPVSGYFYILGTVLLTVYGQLILKWQVRTLGLLPSNASDTIRYLGRLLLNFWVASSFAAAFLAFLCWAAAMTKFELSYAYPFTSLAFVLVTILSVLLFHEQVTSPKLLGLAFIIVGIIIASRG